MRLGFRRPEWVWFAADQNDVVLGVVAGWGAAARKTAGNLDFLDLPKDVEISAALLERAAADTAGNGRTSVEIIHYLRSESRLDDPDVAWLVQTLAVAKFRILVRRHRYRLAVLSSTVTIPDTELTF